MSQCLLGSLQHCARDGSVALVSAGQCRGELPPRAPRGHWLGGEPPARLQRRPAEAGPQPAASSPTSQPATASTAVLAPQLDCPKRKRPVQLPLEANLQGASFASVAATVLGSAPHAAAPRAADVNLAAAAEAIHVSADATVSVLATTGQESLSAVSENVPAVLQPVVGAVVSETVSDSVPPSVTDVVPRPISDPVAPIVSQLAPSPSVPAPVVVPSDVSEPNPVAESRDNFLEPKPQRDEARSRSSSRQRFRSARRSPASSWASQRRAARRDLDVELRPPQASGSGRQPPRKQQQQQPQRASSRHAQSADVSVAAQHPPDSVSAVTAAPMSTKRKAEDVHRRRAGPSIHDRVSVPPSDVQMPVRDPVSVASAVPATATLPPLSPFEPSEWAEDVVEGEET
ncbi:fibrous sheath CABYR-binding protein-like [Schistocerca serialis cubense]|uniref:fibrous sheath CABYR-binding protein-like n=1 Tax=Schistocerca serialis cubense TaxID=2023355 RepID=UPI00214EDE01|nr:fibrous sheath CABYR-binding protein-like [Schistocerca serialis cubense]